MTDPTLDKDSILQSVKKVLGIESEYTAFDLDIIMHVNSIFSTLFQLGLGVEAQFEITDGTDTWDTIFEGYKGVAMIKSYIGMRIKQIFDPFQTGFATDSYDKQIKELEWRITAALSTAPNVPVS